MPRHWTEAELLASHEVAEPLVLLGAPAHGGFDHDGNYLSPRMLHRGPAIEAWKAAHRADFGTEILDAPLEQWPPGYPSIAQSKYLIAQGVAEPTITSLTRIGTVEGFGGMIRHVAVDDLQSFFVESIDGTCTQHLTGGLFEAHARDEAGFEGVSGHRDMWFAARDIAFERPPSVDETETMMARMGIPTPGSTSSAPAVERVLPRLDGELESMLRRMIGLLFIEVSAFHGFAWAAGVLSDTDLVAGDGEAARIVSYIRADETPHVEYLKTTLTEMRDRTFRTVDGATMPGTDVIGTLWDLHLDLSLGDRHDQAVAIFLSELEYALEGNSRRGAIVDGFHALDAPTAA